MSNDADMAPSTTTADASEGGGSPLTFFNISKQIPKGVKRHCGMCRQHGVIAQTRNHTCAFKACECKKCHLVRQRRSIMSQQIRLRREQDKKFVRTNEPEQAEIVPPREMTESTAACYFCQKCKNHGILQWKKDHKKLCTYAACRCEQCDLIDTRRALDSHIKKGKRAARMAAAASTDGARGGSPGAGIVPKEEEATADDDMMSDIGTTTTLADIIGATVEATSTTIQALHRSPLPSPHHFASPEVLLSPATPPKTFSTSPFLISSPHHAGLMVPGPNALFSTVSPGPKLSSSSMLSSSGSPPSPSALLSELLMNQLALQQLLAASTQATPEATVNNTVTVSPGNMPSATSFLTFSTGVTPTLYSLPYSTVGQTFAPGPTMLFSKQPMLSFGGVTSLEVTPQPAPPPPPPQLFPVSIHDFLSNAQNIERMLLLSQGM